MSYYIIKPMTFAQDHIFIMVKKKDVPYEARDMVWKLRVEHTRKVSRFSSMLQFLQAESGGQPYTVVRYTWPDVLMKIPIRDDWTTDSDSDDSSETH